VLSTIDDLDALVEACPGGFECETRRLHRRDGDDVVRLAAAFAVVDVSGGCGLVRPLLPEISAAPLRLTVLRDRRSRVGARFGPGRIDGK